MKNLASLLLISTALSVLASCDTTEPGLEYEVPPTYSFENVDYSGQTTRLNMLEELTAYMKTGNTAGTVLDAQVMVDMYRNENNPFSFTAEKQLKDKTFELDQATFESYMQALATASQSQVEGSNGVAGRVTSNDGNSTYLFDENGVEHIQLIEKGLMGACFYYQATAVYLSDAKIGPSVDNTTVTPGKGTDMEHHWDEAFGYLGVPVDFPTNTSELRFWGKYANGRDAILGLNQELMDGFLTGRAAISAGDDETKADMVLKIRDAWELVSAATAIHYLNEAKANLADDAIRNHVMSEALAFSQNLFYNPTRKISTEELDQVLALIGTNFYEITLSDIDAAIDLLSTVYDLESEKSLL